MKICLCVVSFMLSGCMRLERVERYHYHDAPEQTTRPEPPTAVLLQPHEGQ